MKSVNLLSLVNAKHSLSSSVFDLYLSNFNIKIKENELMDMESLVNQIFSNSKNVQICEGFYVGYTINQISKEFDLLRFGKNSLINIELKRKSTGDKMRKQLIKNKYYLSFLGKKVFSFTYVSDDYQLFYLDDSENLKVIDFPFLISHLNNQVLQKYDNIDKLFDPSNYLVSPFNSTKAFIDGKYFLTDHQENIKKEILILNKKNNPCFISIEGSAGTGKTLLTYDIAKAYINNSKSVLIFHCGSLNSGHYNLRDDYSWLIAPIKNYESYNLSHYDVIIFDEVQRIYKHQLDYIFENIMTTNVKCIFSYDSQQCLASWEIKSNIPQYIKEKVSPKLFKLTEKIRTNKEISSFINNLFDLSNKSPNQQYSNVDVQYFKYSSDAREYIDFLRNQGWKVINYTPSKYERYPYDRFQNSLEETAHNVVGQEYDNVIAVIDKYFYYDQNQKLSTRGWPKAPYYHPSKMLYQMVTRARKKLTIIIINNEVVLNQCLRILQHK